MDAVDYESPIGLLRLEADRSGLRAIRFPDSERRSASNPSPNNARNPNPHLDDARSDLDRYFSDGSFRAIRTRLSPKGTPFQEDVWQALRAVPSGNTATYAQIAERIGNPKAFRAVGLANNRNPIPLLLPCHRIIGANGKLVGYAGEIWRKEWLLRHEGVLL